MSAGYASAVKRTRLGAEIRALREATGESLRSVASRVGMEPGKLSKLENGRLPRPDIIEFGALLDGLGVLSPKREELLSLCMDANTAGWWKAFRGQALDRTRGVAEVENASSMIRQYTVMVMPGLLQTADYARALMHQWDRWRYDEPAEIDEAVAARLTRQAILSREDFRYEVLMDESLLMRLPCPSDVMYQQLDHLLTTSRSHPNVTIRVLPLDLGYLEWLPGNELTLYNYAGHERADAVFLETNFVDYVIDDPDHVAQNEQAYEFLRQQALDPSASHRVVETHMAALSERG